MAMLHARKAKRDGGVRLPAFVLESDNLDSYRPWLKRLREWTRKQGGRIMEAHLIGDSNRLRAAAALQARGRSVDTTNPMRSIAWGRNAKVMAKQGLPR